MLITEAALTACALGHISFSSGPSLPSPSSGDILYHRQGVGRSGKGRSPLSPTKESCLGRSWKAPCFKSALRAQCAQVTIKPTPGSVIVQA